MGRDLLGQFAGCWRYWTASRCALLMAAFRSGDKTFGHRFIGRGELTIKSFAEYEKKLGANGVIVRPQATARKNCAGN